MKKIFLLVIIAIITLFLQGCPSYRPFTIFIDGQVADIPVTQTGDKAFVKIITEHGPIDNASVSINAISFHSVGNGTYLPPPGFGIPYGFVVVMNVDTGKALYTASGTMSQALVLTSPASGSIFASTSSMVVSFNGFNPAVCSASTTSSSYYRLEKAYVDPFGQVTSVSLFASTAIIPDMQYWWWLGRSDFDIVCREDFVADRGLEWVRLEFFTHSQPVTIQVQ